MALGDLGNILMQNLRGIFSDPNMRPTLFQTGAGLMRTPQIGQTGWDVASDSLMRGMETLTLLRERDRVRAEEAARRALEEKRYQEGMGLKKEELGLERTRTAQQGQLTQAQIEETRQKVAGMPAAQEAALAESAAQTAQYKAGAAENLAQAALAGRTDPNLRVAGQMGEGVQSIQAIADQYEAQGMSPVEARATAVRDYQKMKKGTPSQQIAKMVSDRMEIYDPFIFTKSAEDQEILRKRVLPEIMEEFNLGNAAAGGAPAPAPSAPRGPQPGAEFLGKSGNFNIGGKVIRGKVTGLTNGKLVIALDDGTTLIRDPDVLRRASGQ